jgi:hypothetical protein
VPGQGSTFTLALPALVAEPATAPETAPETDQAPVDDDPPADRERVLAVATSEQEETP